MGVCYQDLKLQDNPFLVHFHQMIAARSGLERLLLSHRPLSAFPLWNDDSLLALSWETALLNCFKVGSDAAARIPDGLAEGGENGRR